MPSETRSIPTGDEPDLLHSLIRGERGNALRQQLATRYPDCSADTIEFSN
jgi:hypothetical protein